ncbi:prepilin-type N-terminal cleavage/methylation domain-containing protein [Lacticaseibacillus zhaodongensis]|uniref:prepilin-type N-terminal cleavage/methylation domain-containing protein n=1 Tax=Lacticaseibacillus zhaodongensis TaxID=2668065 RepID=UPI0012D31385|nr:prepilin-type N-terminal cleavage/methylation domain-containing protein [Lacticaseibacillus zhaodongensis]
MPAVKNGATRPGFTMIECTAALVVFAIIALMWQPILHTATHLRPRDEGLVQLLAAQRQLEELAKGGTVAAESGELVVNSAAGKRYEVNYYMSPANGHIIRMTTAAGGYMPLIAHAAGFTAEQVAAGTVQYVIKLDTGDEFTGVLATDELHDVTKKSPPGSAKKAER